MSRRSNGTRAGGWSIGGSDRRFPSAGAALSYAQNLATRHDGEVQYGIYGDGVQRARVERLSDGTVLTWTHADWTSHQSSGTVNSGPDEPAHPSKEGNMTTTADKAKTTATKKGGEASAPASTSAAAPAGGSAAPRGNVSAKQAIVLVLEAAGKPMPVKEIVAGVLATPGVKLGGKTPDATIAAILATENKKGSDGLVKRTKPATYALRGGKR